MKRILFLVMGWPLLALGQPEQQLNAARIYEGIQKLNFLGSVLYVAAHPDDENTRVITYLSKGRRAETGYLAMTRGDGGQNLIGPEIRDQLGLIRTQELLSARRIDGGTQFFTRAIDFGYSKSPDESLFIWGREEVLGDVVRVFRMFQPDVIITRFPTDGGGGHGHHTASAILAVEAFDLAAKDNSYPASAQEFGIWQPTRLFVNTGRWWNRSITAETPGVLTLDVGGYDPVLGRSYTEIAAQSRSQHKTQGFGSGSARGEELEYLELTKGNLPGNDLFDGIDTSWGRVEGGHKIGPLVHRAIDEFRIADPSASVPLLLQIRKEILALRPGIWRTRKLAEVDDLITDCLGLYISVNAGRYWASPGEQVQVNIELVNRSNVAVTAEGFSAAILGRDTIMQVSLRDNQEIQLESSGTIDRSAKYSDPYWLRGSHGLGLFNVTDKSMIGKAENPPAVMYALHFTVAGEKLSVTRPLQYRWTDPVRGEQFRPFEIVPPVFVNITSRVWIFSGEESKDVAVTVKASGSGAHSGTLRLRLPSGWKCDPPSEDFSFTGNGSEQQVAFSVVPPAGESSGVMQAEAVIDGQVYTRSLQTIDYDHIPVQTLLPTAEARVVRLNLKENGGKIAYIHGAGDDVPACLRNMGYDVWEMNDDEVTAANLQKEDAVVLGIRALNTNDRLRFMMSDLLEYVKGGGTLIVQYNNSSNLVTDNFSPYPLSLSRDRVTEEDAKVSITDARSPVLNLPNKITEKDFEGWVQERGLYFPDKWDGHFSAPLAMNDKGDDPMRGSLLVAPYGSGFYVYTGLSFFRELPEGVPGAYRLFANLLSLGRSPAH